MRPSPMRCILKRIRPLVLDYNETAWRGSADVATRMNGPSVAAERTNIKCTIAVTVCRVAVCSIQAVLRTGGSSS